MPHAHDHHGHGHHDHEHHHHHHAPASFDRAFAIGVGLNVAFVGVGESQIELLEPSDPEGTVARFLARRGEGMHHLCFEVPDVDAAIADLAARGVELIDQHAEPGAQGRVAFLHPRANHGVLIELMSQT